MKFAAAATLGRLFIRSCISTCNWRMDGDEDFRHELAGGRPSRPSGRREALERSQYIFLLWHNRLPLFLAWAARANLRNPGFAIDSIISASRDGEILARTIRENGGGEIRGSSSRDAARALRGAVRSAQEGRHIASVGDGPRGPRYELKPGPVLLAKAAGVPIIPFTWACNRTFQLHRSWDQLMAPLPFSSVRVRFGRPVHVPADAGAREIVEIRRGLQADLDDLTHWADSNTRIALQFPRPEKNEILKRRPKIKLDDKRM